jgi:hypothetical protein
MNDRSQPGAPHDRILATATRLFLEHGIQAVSVKRIVVEAGVAQMTCTGGSAARISSWWRCSSGGAPGGCSR